MMRVATALARQAALTRSSVRDALNVTWMKAQLLRLGQCRAGAMSAMRPSSSSALGLEAVVILAALIASMVGASAHLRKPCCTVFLALGASVLT
jgi:hypothetical protein